MISKEELRSQLLKEAGTISHPRVELSTPEHDDLRLRLDSDSGPQWALEAAGRFAAIRGWRIREVRSEGGRTFTLWLTIEPDGGLYR
jgi:hypothetical protein